MIKKDRETPQRQAIIGLLKGSRTHPAAADIYIKLKRKFPNVSFATVYNNLEKLVSCKHLVEVPIDPGKKRFDPCLFPHDHILCSSCGKIFDLKRRRKEIKIKGFKVLFFTTHIRAICPFCLKKKAKSATRSGKKR